MDATWASHLILLNFMTLLIFIEQYTNETLQYATFSYYL